MRKNIFKGISFTVGASLWWGIIGVIYFKFVSYASPLELTVHRTIWTALLLVITTSYYAKWSEFKKITFGMQMTANQRVARELVHLGFHQQKEFNQILQRMNDKTIEEHYGKK